MIGAIHRPQRSTRTPCSTRPSTPFGLTQGLDRPQASLQRRVEQHVVDGEERRRERPVDDAGDRFRPEQPDPARDLAEVDHPVFVEDRIGGEVAEPAAVEAVIDVGVGPELGDHDLKLGRVEIPAERAGDEAAEQEAQRIEAPALQLPPLARRRRSRRRKPDRRRRSRAPRPRPSPGSARRHRKRQGRRGRRARGRVRRRPRAPARADRDRRALSRPKNGGVPSALPMIVAPSGKRSAPPTGPIEERSRDRGSSPRPGARRTSAAMRMKPMNSAP